jgi:hypothetical protein
MLSIVWFGILKYSLVWPFSLRSDGGAEVSHTRQQRRDQAGADERDGDDQVDIS